MSLEKHNRNPQTGSPGKEHAAAESQTSPPKPPSTLADLNAVLIAVGCAVLVVLGGHLLGMQI